MFRKMCLPCLLSVTLLGLFAANAQAQVASLPCTIRAKCSGMVLAVRSYPNGEYIVVQEPYDPNNPFQVWVGYLFDDGCQVIVNPHTQTALEVVDGLERSVVRVAPVRWTPSQKWRVISINGTVHVAFSPAQFADRRLDVPASATHVTHVQLYRPNHKAAQSFTIDAIRQ